MKHPFGGFVFIMSVVGLHFGAYLVMFEQPDGIPSILRQDHIHLLEDVDGSKGDVLQIPDRSGDQIQHGSFLLHSTNLPTSVGLFSLLHEI